MLRSLLRLGDGKLAERLDTQAAALAGYKETKTYIMSLPRRSSQLQCIRFLVLPAVDALLSTPARYFLPGVLGLFAGHRLIWALFADRMHWSLSLL